MWSVPDVNHVSGTDRFGLATPARLALPILRVQTCDLRLRSCKNEPKQYLTMVYSALVLGVSFGSDWLGLNGVSGQGHGTDRRVSGKPTF